MWDRQTLATARLSRCRLPPRSATPAIDILPVDRREVVSPAQISFAWHAGLLEHARRPQNTPKYRTGYRVAVMRKIPLAAAPGSSNIHSAVGGRVMPAIVSRRVSSYRKNRTE